MMYTQKRVRMGNESMEVERAAIEKLPVEKPGAERDICALQGFLTSFGMTA
jgi:hypothetical protein